MNPGAGNLGGAAQTAGRQTLSRMLGMKERTATTMSQMLFETDPVRQAEITRRLMLRGDLYSASTAKLLPGSKVHAMQLGAAAVLLSDNRGFSASADDWQKKRQPSNPVSLYSAT